VRQQAPGALLVRPLAHRRTTTNDWEEHDMLRILADGDGRLRLEDAAGAPVGWIHGRAIGFRGLETEQDAVRAAVAAWQALKSVVRRHYAGWPAYEPALDQLRLVHDGAYEWISDGQSPLARLHRPPADRAPDGGLAIEFLLPSYASEGVAIAAAQVMSQRLQDYVGRRPADSDTTAPSSSRVGTVPA
jgi:hypothetical protein